MGKKEVLAIFKKAILQFVLFSFLFSSASFMFSLINNTRYSSFSSFLVKQRKNNQLDFNYGEVKSNSLYDYTNFYWYADDRPGSNLKGDMHTFFKAVDDDLDLFSFSSSEEKIKSELLLYTTWDFKRFHYGFDIVSNDSEVGLKVGETYITEKLANLLFPKLSNNYKSMIGQSMECNNNKLVVKGIILEKSIGFFKTTVGDCFVLGNYNHKPFMTGKLIYSFIMFGSEINTFADILTKHRIPIDDKISELLIKKLQQI